MGICRISTQLSLQRGFSPVYVASKNGHTEVVDLLVQAGADIHLATTDEVHVSIYTYIVLFNSNSCGDCQTHTVCSYPDHFYVSNINMMV